MIQKQEQNAINSLVPSLETWGRGVTQWVCWWGSRWEGQLVLHNVSTSVLTILSLHLVRHTIHMQTICVPTITNNYSMLLSFYCERRCRGQKKMEDDLLWWLKRESRRGWKGKNKSRIYSSFKILDICKRGCSSQRPGYESMKVYADGPVTHSDSFCSYYQSWVKKFPRWKLLIPSWSSVGPMPWRSLEICSDIAGLMFYQPICFRSSSGSWFPIPQMLWIRSACCL